uniref:BHLH domain-containing protein n=1 Tax=Esox lucius TaxID=8010 RepID=A0A6Q2ZNI6_ESOLU
MDAIAFSELLRLPAGDLLDCSAFLETSCPSSDPGYYSACSSLSPASSIDSGCLSPPCLQWGAGLEKQAPNPSGSIIQPTKRPRTEELPAQEKPRHSRSKFPGKKRETASEREKLRMRDLTKALNHLRTYLPPSVAPAGQTLTKIETLRLTIGYISHLSLALQQVIQNYFVHVNCPKNLLSVLSMYICCSPD